MPRRPRQNNQAASGLSRFERVSSLCSGSSPLTGAPRRCLAPRNHQEQIAINIEDKTRHTGSAFTGDSCDEEQQSSADVDSDFDRFVNPDKYTEPETELPHQDARSPPWSPDTSRQVRFQGTTTQTTQAPARNTEGMSAIVSGCRDTNVIKQDPGYGS